MYPCLCTEPKDATLSLLIVPPDNLDFMCFATLSLNLKTTKANVWPSSSWHWSPGINGACQ